MKRLIAMILVLASLFGMCAMAVSAESTDTEPVQAQTEAVSVGGEGSLGSLLSESIEEAKTDAQEELSEAYVIKSLTFSDNVATV